MYNKFALKFMKFWVDFLYYALPVLAFLFMVAFWLCIAILIVVTFVAIL